MAALLLVDDDPAQVELGRVLLTAAGNAVTVSTSIADAKLKLEDETFDGVVTDRNLEDGKGEELLAVAGGRPVIVVSAVDADEVDALIALGFVGCIRKPFAIPTFAREVAALLSL